MNHPPTPKAERGRSDPHLSEDTCLDLLHGLLPAAEKKRVLAHAAGCPACEALLRAPVVERERLRTTWRLQSLPDGEVALEHAEPVAEDEATGESITSAPPMEVPTSPSDVLVESIRRPRWQLLGGLAAAAMVLLAVLWPSPELEPRGPRFHALQSSDAIEQLRILDAGAGGDAGSAAEARRLFDEGIAAYAERDYPRAAELLGRAELTEGLEQCRLVFLASSLALHGEYKKALESLQSVVLDELPEPWSSEARWTLFGLLEWSGRRADADSLLAVLATEEGEIGDCAREWIGQHDQD